MRAHRLIESAARLAGAAMTVLLLVLWVASGWFRYGWWTALGIRIGLGDGLLRVQNDGLSFRFQDVTLGLSGGFDQWSWNWWGHWHSDVSSWEVAVPLWAPLAIALAATVFAWLRMRAAARRERAGCCIGCGYSRAGLVRGAVCPECGASPRSG